MGAVRFSIDSGLVREITKALPLKVFVETGTYEGDSVRAVRPLFDELHTIELAAPLYERAAETFADDSNVHVHHGRSQEVLAQIVPKLRRRSVLYWLDAHWSDEEHSEGADEQCPLLEELEAIGSLSDRSIVMIDDARFFLAPPPSPAVSEGWPEFTEVLAHLSALNPEHELLVIDDVIVFFPPRVREPLRDYAHHHAVDWLDELSTSRRVQVRLEHLRSDLAGFRSEVKRRVNQRAGRIDKRIDKFEATLRTLRQELNELGAQTQESRQALDEVPAALSELPAARGEIRDVKQQVEPLAAQLESLTAQLTALDRIVRVLRGQVKHADARGQERGAAIGELPGIRAEIASLSTRVEGFASELERLQPAIDRGLKLQSHRSEVTLKQLQSVRQELRTMHRELDAQRQRKRFARTRAAFGQVGRSFSGAGARARRAVGRGLRRVRARLAGPSLGTLNHHPPRELRVPRRYRRPLSIERPPLISVVTAGQDRADHLDRTIRSVLDQDYERLEYIVEDAAPTDATAKVLERHRERLARCERRSNGGQVGALNSGFDHATGDVLSYLRSDSILLPGALAYVARYFERHPEVDVVYGHRVLLDDQDNEIGRWVLPRHDDEVLSWADYIPAETVFWRRSIWEASGGEIEEHVRGALDWELLLRFRDLGAQMSRLPRFLGAHRVPDSARLSGSSSANGGGELRARLHGRPVSEDEAQRAIRGYMRRHVMLQKLYRLHLLRH